MIRSQAELQAFWAQHASAPAPTGINFNGESVVCVLAGYYGSFGHSVEMLRLVDDPAEDAVRVDFVVHPYRGGAAPPQVTETPFAILRTNKLGPRTTVRAEVRQDLGSTLVAHGSHASYTATQTQVLVARDQAELDQLALTYLAGGALTGPLPAVDFARDQVVLCLLGERLTGGFGIAVARAEVLEDGELDLLVHTHAPFGPAPRVITSEFRVVSVPRTEGPVTVRLEDVTPRP